MLTCLVPVKQRHGYQVNDKETIPYAGDAILAFTSKIVLLAINSASPGNLALM
jgi:hypothetical protein